MVLPFLLLEVIVEIMFIFLCHLRIILLLCWPHPQIQKAIYYIDFSWGETAAKGHLGRISYSRQKVTPQMQA